MTHSREEMIHDLKAIDNYFMDNNNGCSPVCLAYAVAAIKQLTAYENAIEEIKKMPVSGDYALGVVDCLKIMDEHLEKAMEADNDKPSNND